MENSALLSRGDTITLCIIILTAIVGLGTWVAIKLVRDKKKEKKED